jgi:iron complex outermembrane receptor protein
MKFSWYITALLAATGFASANEISNDDLFDLDLGVLKDIPVEVASLFEESALDVASSTANIQRSDIQKYGYLTLGESLESVPSVFTSTTWGGSEVVSIRGYSTELSVRGVAHFLDDVPLGTYVYSSPSYILPRVPLGLLSAIEMIRGPGSTLYGTDAFHGVFSFKLNEEAINKTQAHIQLGSPELFQANLLTSRYVDDLWQLHMGVNYTQDGNHDLTFYYDDPVTGVGESGTRDQEFKSGSIYLKGKRGNITHKNGQISLMLFHNNFDSEGFQGVGSQFFQSYEDSLAVQNPNFSQQGDVSGSDSNLSIFSVSHEKLFNNDLQIKNHIYHWKSKQEWGFDNRFYPQSLDHGTLPITLNCIENENSFVQGQNIPSLYCSHRLYQGADETRSGYAVQIKQPQNDGNTNWVMGAGWDEIRVDDSVFQRINTDGEIILQSTNDYDNQSREISYLMAQAKSSFLNNTLFVTYGARWDHYSDSESHFSPRLGVVHKISNTLTQKLLYGHAYRAPTAIEQFGTGSAVIGDLDIKSETIDTTEYVLAYQSDQVRLEGVLFNSEWKNGIALVGAENNTSQYLNTTNNISRGIELTALAKAGPYTISGSSSYVDSENKTEEISYSAFPDWIVQLGLDYSSAKYRINLGVKQRAMLNYDLSDQNSLQDSDVKQDFYRTDTYINWQINRSTQAGLSIQNVFNENNALPSYYGSQGGLPDYGLRISANLNHQF